MPVTTYKPKLLPACIEPGILPLVNALNAGGVPRTTFSCEGHGDQPGTSQPYVDFIADEIVAASFDRACIILHRFASRALWSAWQVTSTFRCGRGGSHIHMWTLSPGEDGAGSRNESDQDIALLADVLPGVATRLKESGTPTQ